jgi:hypothetical protein
MTKQLAFSLFHSSLPPVILPLSNLLFTITGAASTNHLQPKIVPSMPLELPYNFYLFLFFLLCAKRHTHIHTEEEGS